MQQFTAPQFIDVEPKIIGPITGQQFVIMLSYVIFAAILYRLLDLTFFLIFAIPTFFISVFISFIKVNGRPSYYLILNFIQTIKKPNIRVWNHQSDFSVYSDKDGLENLISETYAVKKAPTASKLTELSLIVDTMGAYKGESEQPDIKYSKK